MTVAACRICGLEEERHGLCAGHREEWVRWASVRPWAQNEERFDWWVESRRAEMLGSEPTSEEGITTYWRETYARRTKEARRFHGALIVISEQLRALGDLPWWRRRQRRQHWHAIRDTLTNALDEGMATRGVNDAPLPRKAQRP